MRVEQPSVALHLSGSLSGAELEPLRALGFACGSFHPLQSFADPERALRPIAGITFGIEGDAPARDCMQALAASANANVMEVQATDKVLYHAAAALAANGVVALAHLASGGLELSSSSSDQPWRALEPLLRGTLDNLALLGPGQALTGPIARGDAAAVAAHLQALATRAPQLVPAYLALARAAVDLAERQGRLTAPHARALRALLESRTNRGS